MNLIYDTLCRNIPGIKHQPVNGWLNFNAICCLNNGESRPDTRNRGGIRMNPDGSCTYHCFNCKFASSWLPGNNLSKKMESILEWVYVPLDELKRIKFKVWQLAMNARSANPIAMTQTSVSNFAFKAEELPKGAKPFSHWLEPENFVPEFEEIVAYVLDRGEDIFSGYTYYWSPEKDYQMHKRVIIPFHWEGQIVGYTARDTSGELKNRYYGSAQAQYMFNTESIDYDHKYIFVCEGPFDAIAINGVAMLGDRITPEQADWLNRTGKTIVIVPDREKLGGKLVDTAMKQGWYVSFPKWGRNMNIKDAAQAVKELGKIYTMLSITDVMFKTPNEIGVRRKLALRGQ